MSDAAPTIPGYAVAGLVGQGRAGTVWKATEERSGRVVALKVVPITDSVDAARFQRESRALENLSHPEDELARRRTLASAALAELEAARHTIPPP